MTHVSQKCKVCEEYHCLAGCIPVEVCRAKARSSIAILPSDGLLDGGEYYSAEELEIIRLMEV